MSDPGRAAEVETRVDGGTGGEGITELGCPRCLLLKVRWGKMIFCPRCDRPNGSRKPGRAGLRTKAPRAWGRLADEGQGGDILKEG